MRPENSHKPETRDFQFEGIYAFLEFSNAIFSGSFSWLREILADFLQILFLRIFDGEGNFKDQESRRKSGKKVQWWNVSAPYNRLYKKNPGIFTLIKISL